MKQRNSETLFSLCKKEENHKRLGSSFSCRLTHLINTQKNYAISAKSSEILLTKAYL